MATIAVGPGPNAVAVAPNGSLAYVTNSFAKSPGTVSVIDTAGNTVARTIEVYRNPNRVAITPDGEFAYVANFRSWNVAVIDTTSQAVVSTIPLFGRPSGVAMHPNGAAVYVATLSGRIEVIDTATNTLTASIAVGDSPYGIAPTHDGGIGYVANFGSGTVAVLDLGNATQTAGIVVGNGPFAVAVSCVGSDCTAPAFTPRPTRTPTTTPIATATSSPTATHPPTNTPVPTGTPLPPASMDIGAVTGRAGDTVTISVQLHVPGEPVAGTQNDLAFDPNAAIAPRANGKPDCSVNPDIDKTASAFRFFPPGCTVGVDCDRLRALIFSIGNTAPIANGAVLYTCRVHIASGAAPGRYPLRFSAELASTPDGRSIELIASDGSIVVVAASAQSGVFVTAAEGRGGGGCQIASPASGDAAGLFLLFVVLRWPLRRRS